METNTDKQYIKNKKLIKKLSIILAKHVDDLQRVAAGWGLEIGNMYSQSDKEVIAKAEYLIADYLSSEHGTINRRFRKKLAYARKIISDSRLNKSSEIKEYLKKKIRELFDKEEKFHIDWIAALMMWAMASKKTSSIASGMRKHHNINSLSDNDRETMRKYGIFNDEYIDYMVDNIVSSDIERVNNSLSRIVSVKDSKSADVFIGGIQKAISTNRRQIDVNSSIVANGISNDVSSAVSQKNSKLIDGVLWIAVLDERVCDECAENDGVIFESNNAPICPAHPNCRCHLVPMSKDADDEIRKYFEKQ